MREIVNKLKCFDFLRFVGANEPKCDLYVAVCLSPLLLLPLLIMIIQYVFVRFSFLRKPLARSPFSRVRITQNWSPFLRALVRRCFLIRLTGFVLPRFLFPSEVVYWIA